MKHPKFIPLEAALHMRKGLNAAIGWYAGTRGVKRPLDDSLAQIDLVFEEGGQQRLIVLCVWSAPPTEEQERTLSEAIEYAYGTRMPMISILQQSLEQTGEAASVTVRH